MVLNSNSIKIGIDMWGKYGFVDSHAASAHGKKLIRWTDMSPGRASETWIFSLYIYTYSSSNEKELSDIETSYSKTRVTVLAINFYISCDTEIFSIQFEWMVY